MTDFYLEHIYNPGTSSAPGPHQVMHSPGDTSAGPPHLPTRVAAGPSPAVLYVMVTRPTQPQVTPREAFACPHPPRDRRPATQGTPTPLPTLTSWRAAPGPLSPPCSPLPLLWFSLFTARQNVMASCKSEISVCT